MSADEVGEQSVGLRRLAEIYRQGALGRRPKVPADFAELERRARRASGAAAWAYVAGGAGEGRTMLRNRAAFDRWTILPRVATGVAERDLSVDLFGTRHATPVLLAPVGAAGLLGADSDLRIARAAAATGTTYVLSNQGGTPMEECAAAMGDAERWFQLYWSRDDGLVDSLISRAEAVGAGALVVTLDTTVLGWRPQDLNLGSLPFSRGLGIAQYSSDPRFAEIVTERLASPSPRPTEVTLGAIRTLLAMTRNHPGGFWRNLRSPRPPAAGGTEGHPASRRRAPGLRRPGRGRHRGLQPRRPAGRQRGRVAGCPGHHPRRCRPRADRPVRQRDPQRGGRLRRPGSGRRCGAPRPALPVRSGPRRSARRGGRPPQHRRRAGSHHGSQRRPGHSRHRPGAAQGSAALGSAAFFAARAATRLRA